MALTPPTPRHPHARSLVRAFIVCVDLRVGCAVPLHRLGLPRPAAAPGRGRTADIGPPRVGRTGLRAALGPVGDAGLFLQRPAGAGGRVTPGATRWRFSCSGWDGCWAACSPIRSAARCAGRRVRRRARRAGSPPTSPRFPPRSASPWCCCGNSRCPRDTGLPVRVPARAIPHLSCRPGRGGASLCDRCGAAWRQRGEPQARHGWWRSAWRARRLVSSWCGCWAGGSNGPEPARANGPGKRYQITLGMG